MHRSRMTDAGSTEPAARRPGVVDRLSIDRSNRRAHALPFDRQEDLSMVRPAIHGGRRDAHLEKSAEPMVTLGPASGAAGSAYRPLVFTNTGSRTCELREFPGFSYVAGDDGHQVGPAARMSGERGAQVPIPPGGSAAAELQLVQVRNVDPGVCRPTPVRGLRMTGSREGGSMREARMRSADVVERCWS
jgi:hypothetical protein